MSRAYPFTIPLILVAGVLFAAPLMAAQPWTVAMVPVERQGEATPRPVNAGRFDRENFDGVGASARLNGRLFDGSGRYLVNEGDTWTWELHRVSGGKREVAREEVTYLGGEDRCWSYGHCGALEEISVTIGPECMADEAHEISLYFNGELVDREVFRPSSGGCRDAAGVAPAHAGSR